MKPHFSQHERLDFSTRALKSKKIATLFQLKKRRYLDRKSDAFFWPLSDDSKNASERL